jgi:predicted pyridoxine 5'-phosphate oxidase superfamily flavin-nucleotide-binding protein
MANLPEAVKNQWDNVEDTMVLTTVNSDGLPNSVYVACVKKIADDKIVITDNYFNKTRANIAAGSKGSLLFITKDRKSFQVKGSFEYLTNGPIFDDMKNWVREDLPKVAAAVLHVEEVYSGAEKLA